MNVRGLSYWLCLSFLVSPALCGCFSMSVKAKPVVMAPDLKEIEPPPAPVVGTTTRQQVEKLYGDFRIDPGIPALYWARMSRSDSKQFCPGCSEREWQTVNMVATFDSNQVVHSARIFSDVTLPAAVASMVQQGQMPPLDFSSPVTINALRYPWASDERYLHDNQLPVTVVLAQSNITVSATKTEYWITMKRAHPETVVVPRGHLGDLSVEYLGPDWPISDRTYLVGLSFIPANKLGYGIHLKTTFANALAIARWIAQTPMAPPTPTPHAAQ